MTICSMCGGEASEVIFCDECDTEEEDCDCDKEIDEVKP